MKDRAGYARAERGCGGRTPADVVVRYWLMKSEPSVFSVEDLRRKKAAGWDGVRNYQARNFMREMKRGDLAFFYHSSAEPCGIAGIMEIAKAAYPDPGQFDPKSDHYDPKARRDSAIWLQVDVRFVRAFPRLLTPEDLRAIAALKDMVLFKRGRLSVQPVTASEWEAVLRRAGA